MVGITFSNDKDLLENIARLLRFIKEPRSLASLLKFYPRRILKARLDELEFKSNDSGDNKYFIIKYKGKITEILFINQLLNPIDVIASDKENFIEKLKWAKFIDPKLKFKTVLENILAELNKKNIAINIHNIINFVQKNHLNNFFEQRKKIKISFLFNYLKISLLKIVSLKKFQGSAESLLASATNLTQDCLLDLNTIIFALNNLARLKNIAENDVAYLKNIVKIIFSYRKLLNKVVAISPIDELSAIEIQSLIDATIEDNLDNKSIKSDFIFFKKYYFGQPGFRSILLDNDLYNLIQTGHDKLNSFTAEYIKITNLIEGLSIYSDKIPEIIALSTDLINFTNQYFESLLIISISKLENKNHVQMKIFEDFQFRARLAINKFREKNILSLNQMNILHKILNAIATLMPNFIISRKTRITFFQKYTPQSKQLAKIENAVQSVRLNSELENQDYLPNCVSLEPIASRTEEVLSTIF
jgi:hypothetical protein